MFCPFIKDECRSDCTFRHMPRAAVGNMVNSLSSCVLSIVASEMHRYIEERVLQSEDQTN